MIVDLIIALLKKSRIARDIFFIGSIALFIFGVYEAGKLAERKATDIATKVENAGLVKAQESLQKNVNDQFGTIQKNIDSQFTTLQQSVDKNNANITATRDNLGKLGDVWLRVNAINTKAGASGNVTNINTSKGNTPGEYYAKLPDSSVQFLKGEAYRADQCAVSLDEKNNEVTFYRNLIIQYQDNVIKTLKDAEIKTKK